MFLKHCLIHAIISIMYLFDLTLLTYLYICFHSMYTSIYIILAIFHCLMIGNTIIDMITYFYSNKTTKVKENKKPSIQYI